LSGNAGFVQAFHRAGNMPLKSFAACDGFCLPRQFRDELFRVTLYIEQDEKPGVDGNAKQLIWGKSMAGDGALFDASAVPEGRPA
jgi:hypothetical protein